MPAAVKTEQVDTIHECVVFIHNYHAAHCPPLLHPFVFHTLYKHAEVM